MLIALRESEQNVAAFGIDAVRMRLAAFAFSGALAGFAGAIFAHQQRGLNADSFAATASIDIFVLAVLGGIGSVNGALLGSLYFNVTRYFITSALFAGIVGSGGTLLLLYVAPGGLVSLVAKFRDACLRIVAQRRQMVVPSLFADYDPDALERRLIPLAEASGNSGLGALPGRRPLQPGLRPLPGPRRPHLRADGRTQGSQGGGRHRRRRQARRRRRAQREREGVVKGRRCGPSPATGRTCATRRTAPRPLAVLVFTGLATGVTWPAAALRRAVHPPGPEDRHPVDPRACGR